MDRSPVAPKPPAPPVAAAPPASSATGQQGPLQRGQRGEHVVAVPARLAVLNRLPAQLLQASIDAGDMAGVSAAAAAWLVSAGSGGT